MVKLFHNLKRLFGNSLRARALIFCTMAGLISFCMFGWSLFQHGDFEVIYGEFEYIKETGGGRISPTFHLKNTMGVTYKMKDRAFDCFYRFELEKTFQIGFVKFGGDNVVVACSQGDVKLDVSDGVINLRENLINKKIFAFISLFIFIFSLGLMAFILLGRPKN